jgi:protein tyrosine/serine phosphatase
MKTRPLQIVRVIVRLIGAVFLLILLYIAWDQANYNFGAVQPGRLYRSGQMPATALAQTIREYRIKTVLNLRGPNPDSSWYPPERDTALAGGATQVDIPMSSCLWMTREQLKTLIEILDTAEYPMLIHCWWGSERTGLASAFAELLRPGSSLEAARAQFSLSYLFVRINDGKVMAEHLDQYEHWLHTKGLQHTSETFRHWAAEEFKPGFPNRDQWPRDPYPPKVVTRPGWVDTPRKPIATGTQSNSTLR